MSREIKFRVWDRVDYMSKPFTLQSLMGANRTEFTKDCVVMQYTGLNDKNGKEIYEGDVVEFDGYQNPDSGDTEMNIGEVRYVGPSLCYYEDGKAVYIEDVIGHGCDVDDCAMILGNIYENPELLTK